MSRIVKPPASLRPPPGATASKAVTSNGKTARGDDVREREMRVTLATGPGVEMADGFESDGVALAPPPLPSVSTRGSSPTSALNTRLAFMAHSAPAPLTPAVAQLHQSLTQHPHKGPLVDDVVRLPTFAALDEAGQTTVLTLMQRAGLRGAHAMHALAHTELHGRPLLQADGTSSCVLRSLGRLAQLQLHGDMALHLDVDMLLDDVLGELHDPSVICQSARGTCAATALQYELARAHPRRYLRMASELLDGGASHGTDSNGQVQAIGVVADSIPMDNAAERSAFGRLFQSALMDAAHTWTTGTYSNVHDHYVDGQGAMTGTGGLYDSEGLNAASLLFGQSNAVLEYDVHTAMNVFSNEANTPMRGAVVALNWSNNGAGGHMVTFSHVDGDRVYFRNPWGNVTKDAPGTLRDPPGSIVEDDVGLESMARADFMSRFHHTVHFSTDPAGDAGMST